MPIKMDLVKAQTYIVIYNDGEDFFECGDKESAEKAIEDLIQNEGCAWSDVEVYEANRADFSIEEGNIKVEIAS